MKKVKILICLLALLMAELSFVGYVEAKYASSHDVTTQLVVKIEASKYRLTLDANGGTFGDASDGEKTVDYKATYGELPVPQREGYTLKGWYTKETGGTQIQASDTVEIMQDTVIYAHWTANTYTIAYDANTGTGTMAAISAVYDADVSLSANTFTKTGYTFTGWNTAANGSGMAYEDAAAVRNLTAVNGGMVTLYAQWNANSFAVRFRGNGGSGGMADQPFTYDQSQTLEKNLFIRTGYTFTGWNTAADGSGTSYEDQANVKNLAADDIIDLYAQWNANTYTLSFDTQTDDVEDPENRTVTFGQTYGTLPEPERTGYTFSGWTAAAAGNVYITSGSTVETAGNHTLYAQWDAKTYRVKYHANGGAGSMEDQVIAYDNMFSLRANTFTKVNHNFIGWAVDADTAMVAYIDKQEVVNLLESGTLDLYAVWAETTYTVTFDYNGGSGSPASKEVVCGKAYGVLPTYPTKTESIFAGWYTAADGGERVFSGTVVNRQENHTLYAHWEDSPANDVIGGLVVKNNPDDNEDGVADAVYLSFTCQSYFEKFNIPLDDLVPGQGYRLTYTASNNASFGDNKGGYGSARYGSYIVPEPVEKTSNIENALGQDIIATWNSRVEADGENDGSSPAINDAWLNGPHTNRTIEFTAINETMYWCWEFGLMQDHIANEYNITNIRLEPIPPAIVFSDKTVIKGASSGASITEQTNGAYGTTFSFQGASGCETLYYPISGLTAGTVYTIAFDHEYEGKLIKNEQYHYGCGIMTNKPTQTGQKMEDLGAWASNTYVKATADGLVSNAELTFKATGDTAYWVWNMADCSDSAVCTTKISVTNFSAKHASGGTITYYSAASNAGNVDTLALMPETAAEITLIWEGIDDTNMEIWYPVAEQSPVAGDSYEIAFVPAEGCAMAETVTVTIDGTAYTVATDGQREEAAPYYDPGQNILSIPGQLLTAQTRTVAIVASAVEIQPEEAAENTENTSASETSAKTTETASASKEADTPKTLMEKLLAAQTLQDLYDLLTGDEAGARALSASALLQVRQRADTIYAEAALTEEVRTCYGKISDLLIDLTNRLVNEEEETEPEPAAADGTAAPTDTVEETAAETQQTLLEKLLASRTLQDVYSLLADDSAAVLTAAELAQVRMHADTIYAEAILTEEISGCYEKITQRLNELVNSL